LVNKTSSPSIATGLLVITLVALFPACARNSSPTEGARDYVDELGRSVKVRPYPQRIVSLAPSVTETLFALGLADRTLGVTSFCDYPPEALTKRKVGDTIRPSIEAIIGLKPDLVIASTASQLEEFVGKLGELDVPVYVSNPPDLEGVLQSIERIGDLTGAVDQARSLTASLRTRIDAVSSRVNGRRRPTVFIILGSEPLITAGGASFVNDLIERAGGISISASEPADYPQFSLETAIARRPELIFLQSGEEELPQRLKVTPAARSGRVFRLDDDLMLRPGPRVVDGLEQMASFIHPDD
jgi:iron complex transport system substrate-binding protein